ncbi:hypothetical protein SAMN05216206_0211 [Pseudomonas guineae]|uniref:YqjK-like protein n=1 Tax=Pseudomonas guineae TaxID=425504 RepID=A0A1I3CSU6_9PSED|nr:hypothetical protein [Pseudomonas guineae]SFH77321.1 hypothetical protein SAMN05216206_0211 [Pseudomonas guineae]|tara:strand:- start:1743 stop:2099 length:357 start_codon:yes stop_codon:yes gene_type:complete
MITHELPAKASRRELRKTLLRMRLEMHRQELRHETLVMLQPLRQAQYLRKHWREEMGNSNAPFWVAGSALLMATVGIRRGHWRRWLRIALIAFPLLRRNPPRYPDGSANTSKDSQAED